MLGSAPARWCRYVLIGEKIPFNPLVSGQICFGLTPRKLGIQRQDCVLIRQPRSHSTDHRSGRKVFGWPSKQMGVLYPWYVLAYISKPRAELLDLIALTDIEKGPTYVCTNYISIFDEFRASAFVRHHWQRRFMPCQDGENYPQ